MYKSALNRYSLDLVLQATIDTFIVVVCTQSNGSPRDL